MAIGPEALRTAPVACHSLEKRSRSLVSFKNFEGLPVLVTGADGFIGSHVCEALVRRGARVRAFSCYNSFGWRGWLDFLEPQYKSAIEIRDGDLRDSGSVEDASKGMQLILHLGALIAIPYSYSAPEAYIDTNVKGTLNVLTAARRVGAAVVATSTSEVYGSAQFVPISEAHPLNAQSPYAATKIASDQLALSFSRSFEMPVWVLRPFNTYGPRQSMRAVLPTIIMQLVRGDRKVKLGALHPTRDFTFVEDTAEGFLQVAGCEAALGDVVNIGSSFEITIGDAVKTIGEVMNVDIEIETESVRLRPDKSEVDRLFADTSKAQNLFNWAPKYGGSSGFREGIARTVDWFRKSENTANYRQFNYVV